MIKSIAIGREKGNYYVQTCCGEEHTGQICDCRSIIENCTEKEAVFAAVEKAKEFNVPIYIWYK